MDLQLPLSLTVPFQIHPSHLSHQNDSLLHEEYGTLHCGLPQNKALYPPYAQALSDLQLHLPLSHGRQEKS